MPVIVKGKCFAYYILDKSKVTGQIYTRPRWNARVYWEQYVASTFE
jgi:hypothetical protein